MNGERVVAATTQPAILRPLATALEVIFTIIKVLQIFTKMHSSGSNAIVFRAIT
jgi:hypothetical protein